jgi:hypothetical protein
MFTLKEANKLIKGSFDSFVTTKEQDGGKLLPSSIFHSKLSSTQNLQHATKDIDNLVAESLGKASLHILVNSDCEIAKLVKQLLNPIVDLEDSVSSFENISGSAEGCGGRCKWRCGHRRRYHV